MDGVLCRAEGGGYKSCHRSIATDFEEGDFEEGDFNGGDEVFGEEAFDDIDLGGDLSQMIDMGF